MEEVRPSPLLAHLERIGILESPVVAVHSVWLSKEEIELLAARGGVAHCPRSNGKYALGIVPVVDLRQDGMEVGLGTDAHASRLDRFERCAGRSV